LPESFWDFLAGSCRVPASAFQPVPAAGLPEPARRLLVHAQDMTSTLSAFHGRPLRVDVLQRRRLGDLYLREVLLRTVPGDEVVEYGVIAIALDSFTPSQQEAVLAGRVPLGGLLHQFGLPFTSAPICFFSIAPASLAHTPFAVNDDSLRFGRFNRLTGTDGTPLAHILEILPHATKPADADG
jgi:hypothetical protein